MTVLAWNRVDPAAGGYVETETLHSLLDAGEVRQSWWLGPRLVSVQLSGRRIYKASDRLKEGGPEDLDDLERAGVFHPASWGDCFHQLAPPVPRVRATHNNLFAGWAGGPWEEALRPGIHTGTWNRYDLRSAYRWASYAGLPDPASFQTVARFTFARPGLWLVRLPECPDFPPCHRGGGWSVVSTEELEAYGVDPLDVRYGLTWSGTLGPDLVERTLDQLPPRAAKRAGRAYWGRWAGRDPLVIQSGAGARRQLRNPTQSLPWAWLLVARVRLKLWTASRAASHIYVDEILTTDTLPTGRYPGEWNLKAVYPDGVTVDRTGWWGPRGAPHIMEIGKARAA